MEVELVTQGAVVLCGAAMSSFVGVAFVLRAIRALFRAAQGRT